MSANSYTEGQAVRAIILKSLDGGLTWIPDTTGGQGGGSGTGDMLAANNLSELVNKTTAIANLGLLPWYNVKTYGAVGDGATDDLVAINAAIAAAQAAGRGVVYFPPAVYAVSADLVVTSPLVVLMGAGTPSGIYQAAPTTGSVLKRIGATAGSMVRFETPVAAATAISGCGMIDMALDCNSIAAKGLSLASVQWSTFRNIHVHEPTTVGVDTFINTNAADAVHDVQGNVFERISVRVTANATAIGFRFDGTAPSGNTSLNVFSRISVFHKNGAGLKFLNSDSNTLINVLCNRAAAGTAAGVEFNGTNTSTNYARANSIYFLDAGAGGVSSFGTGLTKPAVNNKIFGYSRENSAPDPVVESTSSLMIDGWFTGTGPPDTVVIAQVGSLYRRLDGGASATIHVKESGTGASGWIAVNTRTYATVTTSVGLTAAVTTADATGGALTETLPTAVGIKGKTYTLVKTDASVNTVTAATTSSQTIDGAATYVLSTRYAFVTVVSDDANWQIIAQSQITEAQVTGLVADLAAINTALAGKQSTALTVAHILVGSAGNVANDVAMSGDTTITTAGVTKVRNYVTRNSFNADLAIGFLDGVHHGRLTPPAPKTTNIDRTAKRGSYF